MIPIRDTVIGRNPPIATWIIIGINVLVFYWELGLSTANLESGVHRLGVVPALLTQHNTSAGQGTDLVPYWSLFTSLFLHGGWVHLIGNMWTLWIFGDNVEDRMGPGRFSLFYFACGLAAGACHVLVNPDSTVPSIGALGGDRRRDGGLFGAFPVREDRRLHAVVSLPAVLRHPGSPLPRILVSDPVGERGSGNHGPRGGRGCRLLAHVGGFLAGILLFRLFLRPGGGRDQFYADEGCTERAWTR